MSKSRYRWWGFVRNMIRDYPVLKEAWNDLHSQSMTANYSGMPKGGGAGRMVESVALRQLPPDDQKDYDAVTEAIELIKLRADGEERLALIRYVYWGEREHPIKDAAPQLNISEPTAYRWHTGFVRLVGKCRGFDIVDKSET